MSRKGENIYKRKDGRWEARIALKPIEGEKRRYHSVYGKTYTEVKERKKQFLVDSYLQIQLKEPKKKNVIFSACAEEWLELQKKRIKPSTYSTYFIWIEKQLLPSLGKIPLRELTESHIEAFLHEKAVCGRLDGKGGLSAKTIEDLTVLLNSILNFAEQKQYGSNPLKNYKRKASAFKSPVFIETLNDEECCRLTRGLMKEASTEAMGILLSLYTGLRLGEICALRWENIDMELELLKIRYTLSRVLTESLYEGITASGAKTQLILSAPKTPCSIRDIPIPQFLTIMLKEFQKGTRGEYYLLSGNSFFTNPRTYQKHFKSYLKKYGIRDITYHCLRHTFATNCLFLDFDIKTLSEILGHANTSITMERYVHSSLYRKQMQMQKLSRAVYGSME